jgi:hypothetical protein
VRIHAVSAADVAQQGPAASAGAHCRVDRPAEESVADEGKYLGPTCPAALYMTSLRYRQSLHTATRLRPSIACDKGQYCGAGDENRTRMASLEGIRVPTRADSDAPAGLTWLHREAPSLALA